LFEDPGEPSVDPASVLLPSDNPAWELETTVDQALLKYFYAYQRSIDTGEEFVLPRGSRVVAREDGRVAVEVIARGALPAAIQELEAVGMEVSGTLGGLVCGWLPPEAIDDLPGLASVGGASAPAFWLAAGSVMSQGDQAQWSEEVRGLTEFDGTGVTVGVISDSYNALGGAQQDISTGDLPAGINVLEDSIGRTDEGRAMLQIVHDVAPGADLAFHTALPTPDKLEKAIRDLAQAGANVIVDDVTYLSEPMFMDGPIAQAVDDVVAGGVLYFSAAGNNADNSYESPFVDSGQNLWLWDVIGGVPGYYNFGRAHDFDPTQGVDKYFGVLLAGGGSVRLSFQWDEPFFSVTQNPDRAATSDLDVFLVDWDPIVGYKVAEKAWENNVGGDAVEVLQYTSGYGSDHVFWIAISSVTNPAQAPDLMKYVSFGHEITDIEYPWGTATSYGHANASGASAVGAAFYGSTPEFGVEPPVAEWFTSLGGVPILFDTDGNRLQTPEIRQTPDITGPDGVNNTFFGSDIPEDPDAFPNFFGTSAAAPHVAAVAALMLDAVPTATPEQVYDALESAAVDMGGAGYDYWTGYGLVHALEALVAVSGGVLKVSGDHAGPGQSDTMTMAENALDPDLVDIVLNGFSGSVKEASLTRIDAYGLGGNDTISADAALAIALHAFGGDGNDVLRGGASADQLEGGAGNDELEGRGGNDYLDAGAGADRLEGGAGNDSLQGGGGDDYHDGGSGDDTYLFAGSAALGEDTIAESSQGGNDVHDALDFSALSSAVSINLSSTQTQPVATNLRLRLLYGDALEEAKGTAFADTLLGNGRSNWLEGRGGNDYLEGGEGDDTYLFAGSASLGNDTVAEAFLSDEDGSCDTLDFSSLGNRIYLNLATTQPQYNVAANLGLTLTDNKGIENVKATAQNDVVWGNDRNNRFFGGDGRDTAYGGYGNDIAYGGHGNDALYGDSGNDALYGEYDDDQLHGGYGNDYLDSGFGTDSLYGDDGDDFLTVVDDEGGDTAQGGYGYDTAYGDQGDTLDAEQVYYPGDRLGGDEGATGLAADDPLAAELVYGGLQDAKTLRRWRELLWFYTEWQKKRGA
jgi:Ca2+-binding RTX toxin-like protein